ncbi:MAG: leucine-rich repeat domain-containing protein [Muribaculaceae bacterium]|nr:leucine-rich repeat domain-containing protein [Muribaculaceae bacterium]
MGKTFRLIRTFAMQLAVSAVFAAQASSIDFTVGDLAYNISDEDLREGECKVSANPNVKYEDRITIPEEVSYNGKTYKVVAVADKGFMNQKYLKWVDFPNSLREIGDQAFYCCYDLRQLDFPESVERIGHDAFLGGVDGILNLKAIKEIGAYAFSGSSILEANISGPITKIYNGTFSDCRNLKEIHLPESIDSIGSSAFLDCDSLRNFKFPSALKYIGEAAFQDCRLGSIVLPDGIETIEKNTFWRCRLNDVVLPNSLKTIKQFAFQFCSLNPPKFPESIEKIEEYAFYYSNIHGILDLTNVKEVGEHAFANCGASEVIIPGTIEWIEYKTFDNCYKLEKVQFLDGVKGISNCAFYYCKALKTVIFPNTLEYINSWVFYHCDNLTHVELPNSLKKIGSFSFNSCYKLGPITIPGSVEELDNQIFRGSNIGTMTFAPSETELNWPSLYGCNVDTVVIGRKIHFDEYDLDPSNDPLEGISSFIFLKDIDATNFLNLNHFRNTEAKGQPYNLVLGVNVATPNDFSQMLLKTLTLADVVPPVCPTFSKEQYDTLQLFVPAEGIEAYRQAEGWKNFFNIKVSGIEEIESSSERTVVARLDLQGRPVREDYKGIVIERYSDGTVGKVLVK